ncbi:MAG: site-specific integrase [Spirochaetaceae bacterium]|jgi:integrase|nr:site-specific integrase [Spirochaetaceae bacterium]
MPKIPKPYIVEKRAGYATYRLSISISSGLPRRVCAEWRRKSFKNFPDELGMYRCPRNKGEAERAALALIQHLKKQLEQPDPAAAGPLRQYLAEYVAGFWTQDSRYAKERALVKKKPLSAAYIKLNRDDVARHIAPFPPFQNLRVQGLKPGIIREWMIYLAEKGLSGRRINSVLGAMRVAVRDIAAVEDLDWDPFKKIKNAPEVLKEKGVLTADEVSRVADGPVQNPASRLAVLLGVFCGMRRGEARGLQWEDIKDGVIHLCHNWHDLEGIKAPKWGSGRIVPVPALVQEVLPLVRGRGETRFVLESPQYAGRPVSNNFFRDALRKELAAAGIPESEQRRRNISFHSLRHTFVTLGRLAGISDFEMQALAGHKGPAMMNRYSHAEQAMDLAAAKKKLDSLRLFQ